MRDAIRRVLQRVEWGFDAAFGARANPWRHLGAIAFFLFWIVAATGAWVYAAFDTSVAGAYASVERITRNEWPLGGLVRSLHRYASDAFALVVLLHLAREWLNGHASGFRWFSWVSGVPLLWLAYASGLGGYWLVFDRLAQECPGRTSRDRWSSQRAKGRPVLIRCSTRPPLHSRGRSPGRSRSPCCCCPGYHRPGGR